MVAKVPDRAMAETKLEGTMKKNELTLGEFKTHLATEEAKRAALVAQGALAYHMGIEQRDCPFPLKDLSSHNLWNEGYRIARNKFSAMLARWNERGH